MMPHPQFATRRNWETNRETTGRDSRFEALESIARVRRPATLFFLSRTLLGRTDAAPAPHREGSSWIQALVLRLTSQLLQANHGTCQHKDGQCIMCICGGAALRGTVLLCQLQTGKKNDACLCLTVNCDMQT